VDGLSLHVPQGSVYGFLGRNGAGKTTTLKMLAGLVHPTSGKVRILGLDLPEKLLAVLDRCAFVGERKALYDGYTPRELLELTRSFSSRWAAERVDRYTRVMEIPLDRKFGTLSLGNRTRVCLLLALAQDPEVLILDEPTSGLDPLVWDQVLRILIEDHVAEGRTVFFSSHNLSELERIADWVGIVEQGRLLLESPLEEIRQEYRRVRAAGNNLPASQQPGVVSCQRDGHYVTYIMRSGSDALAAELRQQGAAMVDVAPLSLREVFLELVAPKERPSASPEILIGVAGGASKGGTHVLP
jgi:ABC-2 type transport system ATP-binding protein